MSSSGCLAQDAFLGMPFSGCLSQLDFATNASAGGSERSHDSDAHMAAAAKLPHGEAHVADVRDAPQTNPTG